MEPFLKFLVRKQKESKRDEIKFRVRPYQVKASISAFKELSQGRNVVIDLPTGAGKTNLAFLCIIQACRKRPNGQKVVYVVPTRVLIAQVSRAASWLFPDLTRTGISENIAANIFELRAAIERSDVVITTPGLFASAIRSGAIDRAWLLSRLPFIVVDEFDEFLTIDAVHNGFKVRYEEDFAFFREQLETPPLLLMSGTAPQTTAKQIHSYTANLLAEFVEEQLKPKTIKVPEKSYRAYIPIARVNLRAIHDDFVSDCNMALRCSQQRMISRFECDNGILFDRDYLMERLEPIASGALKAVRLFNGTLFSVTTKLQELARALLSILQKYTFLFEDMFAGIEVEMVEVPLIIDCMPSNQRIEIPRLADGRGSQEFWPRLRQKATEVIEIVSTHKNQRGVILTRTVRLSDAILKLLQGAGIKALQLDARISGERARFGSIEQFSSLKEGILLLTRTTGKRGLDIPKADYAIVYSPKEDEYVMWQELSRIRSTIGNNGKDSYILYYADTAESNKVERLREQMVASRNRYDFPESKPVTRENRKSRFRAIEEHLDHLGA